MVSGRARCVSWETRPSAGKFFASAKESVPLYSAKLPRLFCARRLLRWRAESLVLESRRRNRGIPSLDTAYTPDLP